MKKILSIVFVLVLTISIAGCGASKDTAGSSANQSSASGTSTSSDSKTSGKIDTITKFCDALSAEQKLTEQIINNYEGMPILELVTPQQNLAAAVFYELLNMDNKEGKFEGKFGLSDHNGFIEKKGNISTFGYDYIYSQEKSFGNSKKGDRIVENGVFDADKQYYKSEEFSERDGKKISVSWTEFQRLADGTFLVLQSFGNAFNGKGDAVNSNKFIYLVIGKDRYDFVIAKANIGPIFTPVLLSDKGEMTKQQASELFKSSGWTIDETGGIIDGKLVKD